ncbi:MAG: hypothetical protein IKA22_02545 [Lentisphaeria bacterium]|nr:hypothetical protein [Lentisphaeria bacterium]
MDHIKIWRSPESKFGILSEKNDDLQDETFLAQYAYTDEVLEKIAADGFNGIWIHGQLHNIIKTSHFTEFAPNSEKHIQSIKTICSRAAKYGIKVYIYMQPPRGVSVCEKNFWQNYADYAGQQLKFCGDDGKKFEINCLCTSTKYVQDYLYEAFANLASALPELGGVIIISASEYPAHCYSKRNFKPGSNKKRKMQMDFVPTDCHRCSQREPEEVVVELLNIIRNGVRSVSKDFKLIFWNWSWTMYLDPPCEEIISKLPQDCILLVDFERGGYSEDGTFINEYSLAYSGPSEQFLDSMNAAKKYGIEVMAKLQLGTTHEIATVRSLPLLGNLFRKIRFMQENNISGFMGCWNFGNLSSANTAAVNFFMNLDKSTTENEALTKFAEYYFPGCNAQKCVQAWQLFTEAMQKYPFCVPFLYNGIINHSLGLLPPPGKVSEKTVGRSWLPDERGDDYRESVTDIFPLEKIIDNLNDIAEKWNNGMELLAEGIGSLDNVNAKIEYGNAFIIGRIFSAAANLYSIYKLKLNWNENSIKEYSNLANKHKNILKEALPYVKQDSAQGFHIEGQFYSFSPEIMEKIINS